MAPKRVRVGRTPATATAAKPRKRAEKKPVRRNPEPEAVAPPAPPVKAGPPAEGDHVVLGGCTYLFRHGKWHDADNTAVGLARQEALNRAFAHRG